MNGNGRGCTGPICALTTLSPVRPEKLWALRRRLLLVAWGPGLGLPLLRLGTIHFARWSVFRSLPHPDGSGRSWPLNWHYLLFEASYDGSERDYLDAFADVLPSRVSKLFGTCFGFQANVLDGGSERRVIPPAAFRAFVADHRLPVLHFAANSLESVNTIRQAIAVQEAERGADRATGDALARAESRVKALAVGPPARDPDRSAAVVDPWRRHCRPAKSVNPLMIAAPLRPFGIHRLPDEPLRDLPRTHFARLVHLSRDMQQSLGHPDPDHLDTDYLLFSADHDGTLDDYVEAIRTTPGVADAIFGRCVAFPGTADKLDFRDWLCRHRVDVQYYVAGYAPRPVEQIERLVAARAEIAAHAGPPLGGVG